MTDMTEEMRQSCELLRIMDPAQLPHIIVSV